MATEGVSSFNQLKELYEKLQTHKRINLFGPPGVGKTWMAKRVSDRCAKDNLFGFTLRVFMCREYNIKSLSETIARQLSLLPTIQEWELEDNNNEQKGDEESENPEKLIEKIKKKVDKSKILLILDDVLDNEKNIANEENFWSIWKQMLPDHDHDHDLLRTILISRLSRAEEDVPNEVSFEVEALPRAESDSLLKQKLVPRLTESSEVITLGEQFIKKSNVYPGTITIIAKALGYFGVSMLKNELQEAKELYNVTKLLTKKHDILPISVLKDLCWHGGHFFRESGSVHFSELITYWILEGFLGFGSLTKLYEKGHGVVIELMECGILKGQEGGYVFMDNSLFDVKDLNQRVDEIASLGLATVFTSKIKDFFGFGQITHKDGMLKTPRTGKKQPLSDKDPKNVSQNLSSLLLDGTHFSEKLLNDFLELETELRVLALFNPTITLFPKPLGSMSKLRVLVLRGCEFLHNVKLQLPDLFVLEISGARSLKSMPSAFFKYTPKLQSLNLSGLQISRLPSSIYELTDLRWLIVKNCRNLKKLESISKLDHLMVVDLSGNTALDSVDKNFLKFTNLQSLNLSNTMVPTTPLLKNIASLTHMILRDCENLCRLRGLTKLTSLQTLDLSGSEQFEEFHDSSLASLVSLRTLNLSGTAIDRLPSNIANPRYLYLKNCLQLQQLSCIDSLVKIKVLDLSGSKSLDEIEDDFFNQMTHLRVLDLSKTKVSHLPSFSELSELRELRVSGCLSLVELPSLESVTKLEILDLSECTSLKDIRTPSFEEMTGLQKLDLSETKIESLPLLSNPSNLRRLVLKNCTKLKNFDLNVSFLNLEELNLSGIELLESNRVALVKDTNNLRILDLSRTLIDCLSISNLTNLTHLSLAGCSKLETLPDLNLLTKLEVLDLSGSSVKHLRKLIPLGKIRRLLLKDCSIEENIADLNVNDPFKPISGLTDLDYIEFPNIKDGQRVDPNQDRWNICQLTEGDKAPLFLNGTQFLQILKNGLPLGGQFHLCVVPATDDIILRKRELVFRDMYLQTSQFARYKQKKSLQIRGFDDSPTGIENIIILVDLISLIDNRFKTLQSGLTASILNDLNGCWIERCDELVTIFEENEQTFALQTLGISNNRRLESLYNGKKPITSFNNLESLYLDGCPKLSNVFPSSWLPETLKVLQIKHCDNIRSLFEQPEGNFPKLETLHLWELPKLESLGASFPSLETLKISECPKITQIEENFEFAKGLKTLWISGATSLKSLYTGNPERHNFASLENLRLENCPMLGNVISSRFPLEKIETIEIRSCEKLRTLFVHVDLVPYVLPRLYTLCLEELPVLKSVGATFPNVENCSIEECPNFKH